MDLGTLSGSSTTEFSAEVEPTVGSDLQALNFGANYSREVSESVKLQQQYIKLTGSIAPTTASLYQEGAPGIDLTGNLIFDVDLTFRRVQYAPVYEPSDLGSLSEPASAGDVRIDRRFIRFGTKGPLCGTLKAAYVIRHVQDGARTVSEHDDEVQPLAGNVTISNIEILPDQTPEIWYLELSDGRRLHFRASPTSPPEVLAFDSRDSALKTLTWLSRSRTATLKNGELWDPTNAQPFTPGELASMILKEPPPPAKCAASVVTG